MTKNTKKQNELKNEFKRFTLRKWGRKSFTKDSVNKDLEGPKKTKQKKKKDSSESPKYEDYRKGSNRLSRGVGQSLGGEWVPFFGRVVSLGGRKLGPYSVEISTNNWIND